jgi:hypothetical protein
MFWVLDGLLSDCLKSAKKYLRRDEEPDLQAN